MIGTVFAYGQTGCGKTFTMIGGKNVASEDEERGIMSKAFGHVFSILGASANSEKQFLVRCSFVELYNEEIRDLLGKKKTFQYVAT